MLAELSRHSGLQVTLHRYQREFMIQSEPQSIEQIRERIRKMSDAELCKYGRAARDLSDPKKNFGPPNPAFKIQLDETRAEWKRRHLKNEQVHER